MIYFFYLSSAHRGKKKKKKKKKNLMLGFFTSRDHGYYPLTEMNSFSSVLVSIWFSAMAWAWVTAQASRWPGVTLSGWDDLEEVLLLLGLGVELVSCRRCFTPEKMVFVVRNAYIFFNLKNRVFGVKNTEFLSDSDGTKMSVKKVYFLSHSYRRTEKMTGKINGDSCNIPANFP